MHPDAHSLAEQIAAMDPEPSTPRDTQSQLIASLTAQFAAGQSETLYGLHTAGADLRRQAQALRDAVEQLPADLHPALLEAFTELAQQTTTDATATIDAATAALSARLSQWKSTIDKAFDKRAAGLASTVQDVLKQIGSAAEDAGDQLIFQTREVTSSAQSFAADAKASADAVTAAGESVIARLIEVLDGRAQADKALEDRLTARIDRLTKRTETTVERLIAALAEQTDALRAQAETERVGQAQQLSELVDRLLALPRGKLKELRNDATKETRP